MPEKRFKSSSDRSLEGRVRREAKIRMLVVMVSEEEGSLGPDMILPPTAGMYEETVGPPNKRGPEKRDLRPASWLDLRVVPASQNILPQHRGAAVGLMVLKQRRPKKPH